jgi:hypothetical protein
MKPLHNLVKVVRVLNTQEDTLGMTEIMVTDESNVEKFKVLDLPQYWLSNMVQEANDMPINLESTVYIAKNSIKVPLGSNMYLVPSDNILAIEE